MTTTKAREIKMVGKMEVEISLDKNNSKDGVYFTNVKTDKKKRTE